MPRIKLSKGAIDSLPTPQQDLIYWDTALPGFGVKVTPRGRKVFVVLYRTGGAGSKLRKYTIGPYGRVTLHHARIKAQKVFVAKLEGRDPAAEKQEAKRREFSDLVGDLLEAFISQRLSQNRSGGEIARLLRREIGQQWASRGIHGITKRDVIDIVSAVEQRGAAVAANKVLKSIKQFLRWCVGRAVLAQSPADGVPMPTKEIARDRILEDDELARIIVAARSIADPYAGEVELLALTGQRREEVAQLTWAELDLDHRIWTIPKARTKNSRAHIVHLGDQALAVLRRMKQLGPFVFSLSGVKPFQRFSSFKHRLDSASGVAGWRLHDLRRTCVSGMARLGIAPHIADKILNHQSGTIAGVAAVYQRHDFLSQRKDALALWGSHVEGIIAKASNKTRDLLRNAA